MFVSMQSIATLRILVQDEQTFIEKRFMLEITGKNQLLLCKKAMVLLSKSTMKSKHLMLMSTTDTIINSFVFNFGNKQLFVQMDGNFSHNLNLHLYCQFVRNSKPKFLLGKLSRSLGAAFGVQMLQNGLRCVRLHQV